MVDHYKQDSHQIMSSERICHHLFANIFRLEMCLNCIKPMLAGGSTWSARVCFVSCPQISKIVLVCAVCSTMQVGLVLHIIQ